MDNKQLQHIIEGALLAAAAPMSIKRLTELFDEGEAPEKAEFETALAAIAEATCERGFELKEVASGWRFQVREELAPWINRLWEEKPQRYSRALLETLSLIAYRQPITRGDIEEIRGVAVSSQIIKTLAERNWVKVVGHRDVPGRPSLYATTREFLDYFNLKSLDELPSLSEIRDLDEINAALDLGIEAAFTGADDAPELNSDSEEDDTEISAVENMTNEGMADEDRLDDSSLNEDMADTDTLEADEVFDTTFVENDGDTEFDDHDAENDFAVTGEDDDFDAPDEDDASSVYGRDH